MKRKEYEKELEPLQVELNQVARWLEHTGKRLVVLFEGRDTAGKGGTINAIAQTLNPRQTHIAALAKPSEREQGQWYFQRYVPHLPSAGEITLFDRSWYNRAGVEKVMGYATPEQVKAFLRQVPVFEKMLVDDGILLFKYWLAVDQEQQEERFAERAKDPLKRWKLSPTDLASLDKWQEYTEAKEAMFFYTDTAHDPWTVIKSNDKKRARLEAMKWLLIQFDYPGKDSKLIGAADSQIIGSPKDIYDQGERPATGFPVIKKFE